MLRNHVTRGLWMILIPLINLFYGPLDQAKGNVYSLVTVLDEHIPFIKYFIVPYLGWYILMFVVLAWIMKQDKEIYISSLGSICLGMLLSFLVYAVFQTMVPRPIILGQDIFSKLTRVIYRMDNPYNAFPSIHVMTAYIILLASSKAGGNRIIRVASQTLSILVILSTVFLKQHTILDVAGGIFLGGSLFKSITLIQSLKHRRLIDHAVKSIALKPLEDRYHTSYSTKVEHALR